MDSIVLYGPGGASPVQLGSYLQADPGPDFGEKGHIEPRFAETPALPGGKSLYTQTHIRKWSLPLMLASYGVSLTQLESLIRGNAVQGGYVDVQPFSVASAEAVRFDLLAGQWEPDYRIRINELGRRTGNLMLQTQPCGYWPTWITLGSAASIGAPGFLPVSGGSVFGDAAGFGEIILAPSAVGSAFALASLMPDVVLWSARGNASFSPFLSPASWVADASSLFFVAGATGPAGATAFGLVAPGSAGWLPLAHYTIPAALEPAFRGRYQGFALVSGSAGYPLNADSPFGAGWSLSLDTVSDANGGAPLGSAGPVATFPGLPLVASQAFQMLPLGPVVLPPVASGLTQPIRLRLWGNTPSITAGTLVLGGLYLMPIDVPGGVLRRGLTIPTVAAGSVGRLALDSYERSVFIGTPTGTLDQRLPVGAAVEYRGGLPAIGSTFKGIDVLTLARLGGYGWGYRQEVFSDLPDHFYSFAASSFPTMIDQSGGLHGSWGALASTMSQATGLRIGADDGSIHVAGSQSQPTGQGWLPVGSALVNRRLGNAIIAELQLYWASQWSVEFWMKPDPFGFGVGSIPASGSGVLLANGGGPSVATDSGWFINWNVLANSTAASTGIMFDLGGDAVGAFGASVGYPYHVVAQWFAPSKTMSIYMNGTLAASKVAAGSYKASAAGTGLAVLGWNRSGAAGGYPGYFDALAIYPTVISASRIAAHYAAGAQGILSQATDNAYYAPIQVQASTRFRPAFQFLKGF